MKSQLTFTPEVLTCFTLYNHCENYYLTLLVIYERLNILTNDLALRPCTLISTGTARRGLATPQSLVPL